jgi:N-acetylglucosaminyl-diphospho-decaprenol L-rhamnosyltransferase
VASKVPGPRRPVVDIVIVDYNVGELVAECLLSIARHPPEYAVIGRIVVVDNASRTPVADFLPSLPLPVEVIRNEVNAGFAAACNQGARGSAAEYILFLNPDTKLLPGSLDVPARFLDLRGNAGIGIVGIQLVDDEGRVSRSCSYHPRPSFVLNKALGLASLFPGRFSHGMMLDWDHATTRMVDGVMGAFFFVRRELFDRLSGFDERFFVYFEETDFGLRAEQAGFRTMYLVDAQAYHRGCGSTDSIRARRLVYSLESRIAYAERHFSPGAAIAVKALTLLVEPLARLVQAGMARSLADARETLTAYRVLWGNRIPGSPNRTRFSD